MNVGEKQGGRATNHHDQSLGEVSRLCDATKATKPHQKKFPPQLIITTMREINKTRRKGIDVSLLERVRRREGETAGGLHLLRRNLLHGSWAAFDSANNLQICSVHVPWVKGAKGSKLVNLHEHSVSTQQNYQV